MFLLYFWWILLFALAYLSWQIGKATRPVTVFNELVRSEEPSKWKMIAFIFLVLGIIGMFVTVFAALLAR